MNKITPHVTEKSYQGYSDATRQMTYTFEVSPKFDKLFIKKKIELEFKVTVEDVRIVNLPGKVRRFKGVKGFVAGRSKAIVRLKKGDKIAAFEIDTKKEESKENNS